MVKGVNGIELKAIKVDNSGRAWRIGVRIGRGEGLLGNLHPRDAPLLERTGSFGDTPATLTSRPVSQPRAKWHFPPLPPARAFEQPIRPSVFSSRGVHVHINF